MLGLWTLSFFCTFNYVYIWQQLIYSFAICHIILYILKHNNNNNNNLSIEVVIKIDNLLVDAIEIWLFRWYLKLWLWLKTCKNKEHMNI
jgi:hypothetical protein